MANKADILKGGMAAVFNSRPAEPAPESLSTETEQSTEQDKLIEQVTDPELKELLRKRQLDGRGRPKKGRPKQQTESKYSTFCVKANVEKWEKLKYISLQETLQIKEVLELALDMLIEKYESEKGSIRLNKGNRVFNTK